MSEYKAEQTASECAESSMSVYAEDTIRTKLPNVLDGLKLLVRRILYTLHTSKKRADEVMKEATLVGRVMEYHPHGDASIAQAISKLCQPFSHTLPLVYSESNIGTYAGKPPAAARYLDVCESEIAKDIFFNDVNLNMLKMVPRETGVDTEPAYLIPRIPTSLITPIFGIALGYKTDTVGCSIEELCKLTKEYIAVRSSQIDWPSKLTPLIKYTLPDFPTYCILRNSHQLLHEYRKGNFEAPILTDGLMVIKNDRIVINTLPPDKSYKNIKMEVGSAIKNPSSFEAQNFQQIEDFSGKNQGVMYGQFTCFLKRGVNPFDVLATLKKHVQFTSAWKPERRYVDDEGNMSSETPLTLLDKWYQCRYAAVLGDLKQTLRNMVNEQRKLLALITVVDHTDEIVEIFKKAKCAADTVPVLCKRFKLTGMQAEYLSKLQLSDITSQGKSDLLQRLEKIRAEMKDLQDQFSKVDQLMIRSIEKFEDKYVKDYPRRAVIPKYIGTARYKGTGWVMLESEEEMDKILIDLNDPEVIEFNLFNRSLGIPKALGSDEGTFIGDLPKYLKAGLITNVGNEKYTVSVCDKGGALVTEGIDTVPPASVKQSIPVYDSFTAIDKQGMRRIIKVTDKIKRKNIAAGPTMKDVVYVSPIVDKECIIIHGNSSQPNRLMIEYVVGEQKLRKIVVGQWFILAVIPVYQKRVYLNIPKDLRQRCIVRHLVLDDITSYLKPGERIECVFGKSTASSDFDIVPLRRKSTIMLAKHR